MDTQPGIRGSISTVYQAQWAPKAKRPGKKTKSKSSSKNVVALKVMRTRSQKMRDIYDMLFILRHPNIINVIDFINDPVRGQCTMVTNWIDGVNLMQMVKFVSPQGINETVAANIGRQIVLGLAYLHERRIFHG